MPVERLGRADEKLLFALRRRKEREARRLFIAEGVRVAEELLGAGVVLRMALVSPSLEDTDRGRALAERLKESGSVTVSEGELARLAATETPQGVLLVAESPRLARQDIVLGDAATILVLDAIQDPGNFGTLVRAADAFRVAALIALPGTVDAWNPKAVRAAAGSSFRVPILFLEDDDALDWLKCEGFALWVAEADGQAVGGLARPDRTALVIGNEGAGVRAVWRAAADAIVSVPVPGTVESLNAAVAAGILLYAITTEKRYRNG
jgi:TrmH family RNA methyltransferase